MKNSTKTCIVPFFVSILLPIVSYSQTCMGYIKLEFQSPDSQQVDLKTFNRQLTYINTFSSGEFYYEKNRPLPLETVLDIPGFYIDEKINNKARATVKEDTIKFPTYCGYYLINLVLENEQDTMHLSFYNVSPHVSFLVKNIPFLHEKLYYNIGEIDKPADFATDINGLFLLPDSLQRKFP